jgi:CPA1 family monovalent cation:H+ antiporter
MAIFDVLAVLMVLAATFGWVNDRYARLPVTVGIMAMGLTLSLALVTLSLVYPPIKVDAQRLLAALDFDQLLLHGALGFLLFAGALHIELGDLREHRVSIGVLAVVGTLLSTGIVGGLCWLVTRVLNLGLTPFHCLLFGALISPTDPIAVLGMLKSLGAPRHLEVQIAGESLFNDCVGWWSFSPFSNSAAALSRTAPASSSTSSCSWRGKWWAGRRSDSSWASSPF